MTEPPKSAGKRLAALVNRERELTMLLDRLPPRRPNGSIVVLKAPSGFGKTRLTTKILEELVAQGVFAVAVEPQVRAKNLASSVYQGFYLQRCAEALDEALRESSRAAPRFEVFLKAERLTRAKGVDVKGALRKPPGLRMAYTFGLELIDRLLNTGDHSPKKLLTSDSREAIDTCARYIRHVAEGGPMVLVVREAQHIDQTSLNLLTEIAQPASQHALVLEYTLDATGHFNQLFADLLETADLQDDNWLRIVELLRLSQPHLAQLLRVIAPAAGEMTGEYYLHWDGNVRSISQLKFSISVEHLSLDSAPLQLQAGVVQEYQRQIQQLASSASFALCLLLAHGEAMPASLLALLLQKANALATKAVVEELVETLVSGDLVTHHTGDQLGVENEDLAEALRTHAPLAGNLLLAKGTLRDYYRAVVIGAGSHPVEVSFAVRQTLRLAVELGDAATIEDVVAFLSQGVTASVDQSWYVAQIVAAVSDQANLFADQQDRLQLWAAELAYEISDFRKSRDLLRRVRVKTAFSEALLCACCTETGDHGEALQMAERLMMGSEADERFAGQLVELILLRCTGKIDDARSLWDHLAGQPDVDRLKLYGYLLRFKELVADFPECLEALQSSTQWFLARGLTASAAYSDLTIAGHLARQGDDAGAAASLARARDQLALLPRDQHMLLNNEVAVNLLSSTPDPASCCDKLVRAIPGSGDDYSDLVLYTNLAVCAMGAGRNDVAAESTGRALRIAASPNFADRDVFWGVSFNLRLVNEGLALGHDSELDRLVGQLRPHSLQSEYWQHRYGMTASSPARFQHMLSKPFHPMFLSHWTIDVDGLRALKPATSTEPLDTTSQPS